MLYALCPFITLLEAIHRTHRECERNKNLQAFAMFWAIAMQSPALIITPDSAIQF